VCDRSLSKRESEVGVFRLSGGGFGERGVRRGRRGSFEHRTRASDLAVFSRGAPSPTQCLQAGARGCGPLVRFVRFGRPHPRPLWTVEPATWTILLYLNLWIKQYGPCCANLGWIGRLGSPQWTSPASGMSRLRRVAPGSSCGDAAPPRG